MVKLPVNIKMLEQFCRYGRCRSGMKESSLKNSRKIGFAVVLGIIISFFYAAGYLIEAHESLDLKDKSFYLRWIVEAVLAAGILFGIWELADRYGEKIISSAKGSNIRFMPPYPLCVLILFLCWTPAWLSIFPGAFNYDAYAEWIQVVSHTVTNHHPVIHVLWVGGLLEGFHALTGSYNPGIAVYTCLQMLLLAGIFVYTLRFLKEFHVPDIFCFLALIFYGTAPVIQLFAASTTKDVLFSAALLVFLLSLIRLYCRKETFFQSKQQIAVFGISSFASMILRNNGLYIVVFTLMIVIFSCWKYRKKLLPVCLFIGIAYGLYIGPFFQIFQVTPGGVEEMLSVPLQQMARVYKYDRDSLEEQDVELLCRIIPRENLESYRSTVSDFVKSGFQKEEFAENKKEFFILWCKWGMKHPLTYVNSFLINTVDFWYPGAVVDGYRHADGRSSYFDYKVDIPGEEKILLPRAHDYYEAISHDNEVQKKPFAFLVLSPGWYLVTAMTVFGYLWCRKKYNLMIVGWVLTLTMLTVLAGPMALVRYVLILYYAFPILLILFLGAGKFSPPPST